MLKAGQVFENPVTGEFGYVRKGVDETSDQLLIADLRVRPGGSVVGEHVHPIIHERFTIVSGQIGYRLNGKEGVANPGDTLDIPTGVAHDWWNAGSDVARVIVQVKPGARFEQMALTLFGLAQDGETDKKGLPNLLQMAVIANEYGDVLWLTKPPRWIQKIFFTALAPLGRLIGYRASYERYQRNIRSVHVEPIPDNIEFNQL
jgi:quercetin dioxygenase-like cupin family protein